MNDQSALSSSLTLRKRYINKVIIIMLFQMELDCKDSEIEQLRQKLAFQSSDTSSLNNTTIIEMDGEEMTGTSCVLLLSLRAEVIYYCWTVIFRAGSLVLLHSFTFNLI